MPSVPYFPGERSADQWRLFGCSSPWLAEPTAPSGVCVRGGLYLGRGETRPRVGRH